MEEELSGLTLNVANIYAFYCPTQVILIVSFRK